MTSPVAPLAAALVRRGGFGASDPFPSRALFLVTRPACGPPIFFAIVPVMPVPAFVRQSIMVIFFCVVPIIIAVPFIASALVTI